MSRSYAIRLRAEGGRLDGDLTVAGFETSGMAEDLGGEFAEVLRRRWPGTRVTVTLLRRPRLQETSPD